MKIQDGAFKSIGRGAEGEVYQIDSNLVAKRWREPLAIKEKTPQGIIARFRAVEKAIPEELRHIVKVPEVAGYEIDDDGKIITYHEYIKGEENHQLFVSMYEQLSSLFYDFWGDNVLVSGGKLYLVDVWPPENVAQEGVGSIGE